MTEFVLSVLSWTQIILLHDSQLGGFLHVCGTFGQLKCLPLFDKFYLGLSHNPTGDDSHVVINLGAHKGKGMHNNKRSMHGLYSTFMPLVFVFICM